MRYTFFIFLFLVLSIFGCSKGMKSAGGSQTEIIVFAEREMIDSLRQGLSSALEREMFSPTKEQVFTLIEKQPGEFPLYNRRRNIIILGTLGNPMIDTILSESAKQEVREGMNFVFGEQDLYVKGQAVCVIAGKNLNEVKIVITEKKDELFSFFVNSVKKRLKKTLYEDGYQEKLKERLLLLYNFTLEIPRGWLTEEHGRKRLIKILRHYPDRFITIYWEYSPGELLTYEEICDIRDSISIILHDGDRVDRERSRLFNADFHHMSVQKLDGIWQNDELVMGGPFRTYIFSTSDAFYFIDMYVFSPGEKISGKSQFKIVLEIT